MISGCSGRDVVGLAVAEQLLVQLLALAQAGVLDRRSRAPCRSISCCATSTMRTGSPMSSTSASPGAPIAPAWMTSWHGLLDGHEVAGDVGVGDGDRAAAGDLRRRTPSAPTRGCRARCRSAPRRSASSAASRGVASPSAARRCAWSSRARSSGLAALSVEMLTKRSTPAASAASSTLRVPMTLVFTASAGYCSSSGQVLERRGVEDDLGPPRREDLRRARPRSRMSHSTTSSESSSARPSQRQLHGVQGGLVAVEHDQLGRAEPVDLAAQLGADRAAGAGDEHPLAGQVAGDGVDVGVELVAAEQVGEVEVADVADARHGR